MIICPFSLNGWLRLWRLATWCSAWFSPLKCASSSPPMDCSDTSVMASTFSMELSCFSGKTIYWSTRPTHTRSVVITTFNRVFCTSVCTSVPKRNKTDLHCRSCVGWPRDHWRPPVLSVITFSTWIIICDIELLE